MLSALRCRRRVRAPTRPLFRLQQAVPPSGGGEALLVLPATSAGACTTHVRRLQHGCTRAWRRSWRVGPRAAPLCRAQQDRPLSLRGAIACSRFPPQGPLRPVHRDPPSVGSRTAGLVRGPFGAFAVLPCALCGVPIPLAQPFVARGVAARPSSAAPRARAAARTPCTCAPSRTDRQLAQAGRAAEQAAGVAITVALAAAVASSGPGSHVCRPRADGKTRGRYRT